MARRTRKEKRKSNSDSELWVAGVAGIVGLIGGMLFLSPNITGNAVGVNELASNIFGTVLLVTGLIGSFFWLRSH
ncbi:hypothetical protein A3K73_02475 [Candidatus Pacearchaeota archaeon RBG_13_36_9]|nr:MAG: hypothetical protein A3K73_02475 [Candidatus Pacearchaeota archaeon RBG_13_36_9]